MAPRNILWVFLFATSLVLAGIASAAEEAPTAAPADSELVASLNVRGIVDSDLFQRLLKERGGEPALARIRVFKNLTGVDLLKDVDRAYLWGRLGDDNSMVVNLLGRFDQAKITDLLVANAKYASHDVAGRKVMEWYDDKEKRMKHGAFMPDGSIMIANQPAALEAAFAAKDGGTGLLTGPKAASLPAERDAAAAWAVVFRPHAPVETLAANTASVAITLDAARVAAQLLVSADSEDDARKWNNLLSGGIALLQLQKDRPAVRAVADSAKVSLVKGDTVRVELSATHDQFLALHGPQPNP